MNTIFTLDGQKFKVWAISVHRNFSLKEGSNSGDVLSGRYRRDLIGTYYSYTMVIDPCQMLRSDYDRLYELLSAPVESHTLAVPYGQGTLIYEAYITGGDDDLVMIEEDGSIGWGDLTVQFDAMEPQRRV